MSDNWWKLNLPDRAYMSKSYLKFQYGSANAHQDKGLEICCKGTKNEGACQIIFVNEGVVYGRLCALMPPCPVKDRDMAGTEDVFRLLTK